MIYAHHSDLTHAVWRKAQASDNNSGCVELADLGDGRVALRDSKDLMAPAHVFTRFEIACLIDGVKRGEFDDLVA
jgi:hypothetical protein